MAERKSREAGRPSLREITADAIIDSLNEARRSQPEERKFLTVLVTDEYTFKLLEINVGNQRLLDEGFCLVEVVKGPDGLTPGNQFRPINPELDAVYFIRYENVGVLLSDFDVPSEKREKRSLMERCFPCVFSSLDRQLQAAKSKPLSRFHNVYLCIANGSAPTEDDVGPGDLNARAIRYLENMIHRRPNNYRLLKKALKHSSNTDMPVTAGGDYIPDFPPALSPVEYFVPDGDMFLFNMPETMAALYHHSLRSPQDSTSWRVSRQLVTPYIQRIARKLASVCITLKEMPFIAFQSDDEFGLGYCEFVASETDRLIKTHAAADLEWRPYGKIPASALQPGEPTGQATLLILDRINDLAPILMHDTTYEGLTIDLLDHTPGLPFLPPNSGPTAKTMLDDRDSVWQQHRTLNWNHVVESLSNAARKLNAQEMELEAIQSEGEKKLRKLRLQETTYRKKIQQHTTMMKEIIQEYRAQRLTDMVEIEQTLMTGVSKGLKEEKWGAVKAVVSDEIVQSTDPLRLLRLALLYVLCAEEVTQDEVIALLDSAHGISGGARNQIKEAILALPNFRVRLDKNRRTLSAPGAPTKDPKQIIQALASRSPIEREQRYNAKFLVTAMGLLNNNALPGNFSYAGDKPSDAVERSSLHTMADFLKAHAKETAAAGEAVRGEEGGRGGGGYGAARPGKASARKTHINVDDVLADTYTAGKKAATWASEGKGNYNDESDASSIPLKTTATRAERKFTGSRLIVFVLGGIAPAEMSGLRFLSGHSGREIIIGSTSVFKPRDIQPTLMASNNAPLETLVADKTLSPQKAAALSPAPKGDGESMPPRATSGRGVGTGLAKSPRAANSRVGQYDTYKAI